MSLFEHENHRLAGRALVIVSTMTIFLQQCTRPFAEISLLGFKTQINSVELSSIMTGLVLVYGFLFVFRVVQSDIYYSYRLIEEQTKERRETAQAPVIAKLTTIKEFYRTQVQKGQGHLRQQEIAELSSKMDKAGQNIGLAEVRFKKRYFFRGWAEYVFRILIEVFVPLSFGIVALIVPVGGRICASFTAEISLLSIVP